MKNRYRTEQEEFWAGDFGNNYIDRNKGNKLISSRMAFFSKVLSRTDSVNSLMEFGANIGLNMRAIKLLKPEAELTAVEINKNAVEQLNNIEGLQVHHQSMLEYTVGKTHDFVFTKGVLIHINPDKLQHAYEILYKSSNRYIFIMEYYNPVPVTIDYRGNTDRLFKRDFAGEIMDRYPDLHLVDYGFVYHRDNNFPQDDGNWFLMEKR